MRPSGEIATSCGPRPVGSFTSTFCVAGSTSANWKSDLQTTTTVSASAGKANAHTANNAARQKFKAGFFHSIFSQLMQRLRRDVCLTQRLEGESKAMKPHHNDVP